MSEPKRYTGKIEGTVLGSPHWEHPEGEWVKWEDYARLQAECQARQAENSVLAVECDSLKAEVERLTERNQHLEQIDSYLQSANLNAEEQRSFELEAQVERLTKAGDAMEDAVIDNGLERMNEARDGWNAAKEGKNL
jgi:predicted nuclease with TOPRIM domain